MAAQQKKDFKLVDILTAAADHMKLDLQQRLTSHPGELGTDREEIVRGFLRRHLPRRFEISTGFIFDSHGTVSEQIDIIISDADVCTSFETAGGTRYYPCEAVVGVGQVKSSLTSKKGLIEALDNLESAKRLDRSASGSAVDRHGQQIEPEANHLDQIFTFILVTGKALNGETARKQVSDYISKRAPHLWPNVVFALENYIITYCCEHGVCPNPMDARGITLQPTEGAIDLTMRFFLLLGRALEVTSVSALPYWEYMQPPDWTGDIAFNGATGDEMPPLLSEALTAADNKGGTT